MPTLNSAHAGFPLPGAQSTDTRLADIQAVKAALVSIDSALHANTGDHGGLYAALNAVGQSTNSAMKYLGDWNRENNSPDLHNPHANGSVYTVFGEIGNYSLPGWPTQIAKDSLIIFIDGGWRILYSPAVAAYVAGTPLVNKGTWDANMNMPSIGSNTMGLVAGDYYTVMTAGTSSLPGALMTNPIENMSWTVGDKAVYGGPSSPFWTKAAAAKLPTLVTYKGTYDADLNMPSIGTNTMGLSAGDYCRVTTASASNMLPSSATHQMIMNWTVGDFAVYDGAMGWFKV